VIAGAGSVTLMLAGCNNGLSGNGAEKIDARVDAALNHLYATSLAAQDLRDKSVGMLVMPLITKAGLGIGGAYGRGALRVGGVTVDYYSAAKASFGFQLGVQQYAHVLFFMTEDALAEFRNSAGWSVGANVEYVVNTNGETLSADTTTALAPVIAMVFGQAGLIAGATLEGTKYTRIIP